MEEFSLFNQKKLTIIAKYSGGTIQGERIVFLYHFVSSSFFFSALFLQRFHVNCLAHSLVLPRKWFSRSPYVSICFIFESVRVGGGTKNIQEYLKSFREKARLGVFKKSLPLSSSPSSPRRLSDLGSSSRSCKYFFLQWKVNSAVNLVMLQFYPLSFVCLLVTWKPWRWIKSMLSLQH